jgi:hypothetical protein
MGNRSIADCESHPGVSDRYGPGGPQLKTNTQWRRWVDGGPSFICAKIGSRGWQADINTPLPPATPDAASESYSGALRARPLPLVQPFLVFGRRAENGTPRRRPGSVLDHAANSEHKARPFLQTKRDVRVRGRDGEHRQQVFDPDQPLFITAAMMTRCASMSFRSLVSPLSPGRQVFRRSMPTSSVSAK